MVLRKENTGQAIGEESTITERTQGIHKFPNIRRDVVVLPRQISDLFLSRINTIADIKYMLDLVRSR